MPDKSIKMEEKKQERTVVHLELNGQHYYYGNLKALCEHWSKENIGVTYNYLRNYGIEPERPFIGKMCIIRKGIIVTTSRVVTQILAKDQ